MTGKLIFVSGAPRTGTGHLLELLGSMQGAQTFSQPLPLLYIELKRRYLQSLGAPKWHLDLPFAEQAFDTSDAPDGFTDFLDAMSLSNSELHACLEKMARYSGQYFKPDDRLASLKDWKKGTLYDFLKHYFVSYCADTTSKHVIWKETFSEEIIPYLRKHGAHVVLTIRDPRDSITSQLSGDYETHTGTPRPLLFMIRQWRKAAAYFLEYANASDATVVRFEDIVTGQMPNIGDFPIPRGRQPERSDERSTNTSFVADESTPVGRHKNYMTSEHQRFTEALCFFEMKALGYEPQIDISEIENIICGVLENDHLERESLKRYAYQDDRRNEELARFRSLTSTNSHFDHKMFIFRGAYEALRSGAS